MEEVVKDIKSIWRYRNKVRIDNVVFNLHKFTAAVLLLFGVIIAAAFMIKDPIHCINDATIARVVNAYCWIHATYTIPEKLNGNKSHGALVAHPGVAQLEEGVDDIRVHKYYQWVWLICFFQAVAFYTPRYIWKHCEEGRIKSMSADLVDLSEDDEKRDARKKKVQKYFRAVMGKNDPWSMKYALCEVLNFINVIVQIDLTDRFLGRAFSTYGFGLFHFFKRQDPMYRTDALAIVFPTVSKCTFNMVGPSGNIIPYDALCVLPFNMYNEKFYPLLLLWFTVLAVLSGCALIYRLATFLFPELRFQLLRRKFQIDDRELDRIWELNRKLHYGDWYLLYQIGKNMGPSTFLDFLNGLADKVAERPSYERSDTVEDETLIRKPKYL